MKLVMTRQDKEFVVFDRDLPSDGMNAARLSGLKEEVQP